MTARLAAGVLVTALIRQVQAAGGFATVLARGDADAGAVLLLTADRGVPGAMLERVLMASGGYGWVPVGPEDPAAALAYLDRRRTRDPDLWIVELDVAEARAIADRALGW